MERRDRKEVDRRVLIAGIGGAVAGSLLVGGKATAGVLNPSGPPGPTMKALDHMSAMIARTDLGCSMPPIPIESLPGDANTDHIISVSGSYYQVGNVVGSPDKTPLAIRASNVDFCGGGFHIFVTSSGVGVAVPGVVCDTENVSFYDASVIGGSVGVDFGAATRFIIWDVTVQRAQQAGFLVGGQGNFYDSEAHGCLGFGILVVGSNSLCEEGSSFSCGTGIACTGAQNAFMNNFVTNCPTPYSIGPGNSYGPICNVVGVGDISSVPGANHPRANYFH